jgi:hypothetical protein
VLVQRWPYRLARLEHDEAGDDVTFELYDVKRDPEERNDLAADRPALVAELAARLEERRSAARAGAPAGEEAELDPELRERLKALGYTE